MGFLEEGYSNKRRLFKDWKWSPRLYSNRAKEWAF